MRRRGVVRRRDLCVNGHVVGELRWERTPRGSFVSLYGTGTVPPGIHVVEEVVRSDGDPHEEAVEPGWLIYRGPRLRRFRDEPPALQNTSDDIVHAPVQHRAARRREAAEARTARSDCVERHGVAGPGTPALARMRVAQCYRTISGVSTIVLAATETAGRACLCVRGGCTMPVQITYRPTCECATAPACWCNTALWASTKVEIFNFARCETCEDRSCAVCRALAEREDVAWVPFIAEDVF